MKNSNLWFSIIQKQTVNIWYYFILYILYMRLGILYYSNLFSNDVNYVLEPIQRINDNFGSTIAIIIMIIIIIIPVFPLRVYAV